MRVRLARAWPVAVLLGVTLAGCGAVDQGSGNQPQQSTSLADLREKITFIEQDPCFTGSPRQVYAECGARYITEVNNAALMAQDEAANANLPQVAPLTSTIRSRINDFTGRSCPSAGPALAATCAEDLQSINTAFDQLGKTLPTQ